MAARRKARACLRLTALARWFCRSARPDAVKKRRAINSSETSWTVSARPTIWRTWGRPMGEWAIELLKSAAGCSAQNRREHT